MLCISVDFSLSLPINFFFIESTFLYIFYTLLLSSFSYKKSDQSNRATRLYSHPFCHEPTKKSPIFPEMQRILQMTVESKWFLVLLVSHFYVHTFSNLNHIQLKNIQLQCLCNQYFKNIHSFPQHKITPCGVDN